MTRPDPRPIFLNEHGDYVFEDGTLVPEQPLALRAVLVGGLVTAALIVVFPLLIGFAAYRTYTNDNIRQNEQLIERVNSERIARTRAINEFIYEQCIQSEIRDVVMVQHLQRELARGVSLTDETEIRDAINALEPENEQDCRPPAATTQPKGTP